MNGKQIFCLNRRSFVKWSALVGSSVLLNRTGESPSPFRSITSSRQSLQDNTRIVKTGCPSHNCGGRCLLGVHVKDGIITRIETDDRQGDQLSDPQLRACIRGRAYRKRQYHPDRLKYPLKRKGNRGEGKFERVTWDEAYTLMRTSISKVIKQYGNSAIFIPYGTGSYTNTNGRWPAARLMNLLGGCLGYYNSYSWACTNIATPYVYGTLASGNQRQDWMNSRYIPNAA